jgi:hypothetical protein
MHACECPQQYTQSWRHFGDGLEINPRARDPRTNNPFRGRDRRWSLGQRRGARYRVRCRRVALQQREHPLRVSPERAWRARELRGVGRLTEHARHPDGVAVGWHRLPAGRGPDLQQLDQQRRRKRHGGPPRPVQVHHTRQPVEHGALVAQLQPAGSRGDRWERALLLLCRGMTRSSLQGDFLVEVVGDDDPRGSRSAPRTCMYWRSRKGFRITICSTGCVRV